MPIIIFFVFILILFIFLFFYLWRKKRSRLLPLFGQVPKEASFELKALSMLRPSSSLQNKIDLSLLVHGTFVGDDPLHINEYLELLMPQFSTQISKTIKNTIKGNNDFFAKDLGNFTQAHEQILVQKVSHKSQSFVWSSANTHMGRVKALLRLVEELSTKDAKEIMLIGHSHGGQIFALLTQVLSKPELLNKFCDILSIENKKEILSKLNSLKNKKFFIVTLGTPVRYTWVKNKKIKIIHIINHRGDLPVGGTFKGALYTVDGDYIQQWGVAGSDSYITHKLEHEINQEFDSFLDIGRDLSVLKQEVAKRKRLHNLGHHVLIDLEDKAKKMPNFYKTIFGHGTYTKVDVFEKLLDRVIEYYHDN